MDNQTFISQFEETLKHTLADDHFDQATQLVSAYAQTQLPYTQFIYSQINRIRHNTNPFSLSSSSSENRIIFYLGDNYILNYIADQFAAFFKESGCQIFLFDSRHFQESSDSLFKFLKQGADATFFFNNTGLAQTFTDGTSLWQALNIPCFDFLVDHPMYYADSLDHPPVHTTLLCADKNHAEYAKRFYPDLEQVLFFPTGGAACPDLPDFSWKNRPMDVLFIGSYKCNTGYPYDELDSFVMTYLQNHSQEDFVSAVELYVREYMHLPAISDEALKEIIESHRYLETNLTALYRKEIISKILEQGIQIHVFGNGWESSGLTSHPCFHLHPSVSFEEGISCMNQTKIVLNHMAWFKTGSSERIFNAMSQGSLCLTDSSFYLQNILSDHQNCLLYDLDHLEQIPDQIISILHDPQTASTIAKNGYICSQENTWQKHLRELSM